MKEILTQIEKTTRCLAGNEFNNIDNPDLIKKQVTIEVLLPDRFRMLFAFGILLTSSCHENNNTETTIVKKDVYYTCSMYPQVHAFSRQAKWIVITETGYITALNVQEGDYVMEGGTESTWYVLLSQIKTTFYIPAFLFI